MYLIVPAEFGLGTCDVREVTGAVTLGQDFGTKRNFCVFGRAILGIFGARGS